MTDDEKILFIAQHPKMKNGDLAPFLGMRPSAVMAFVIEHKDEIAHRIGEQAAEEPKEEKEAPEQGTATLAVSRLAADVTRLHDLCAAYVACTEEQMLPPREWMEEIRDRADEVLRDLWREEERNAEGNSL